MVRHYMFLFFMLLNACASERTSDDLNLKTIWITWDDWQGLYRIDSVCIGVGSNNLVDKLNVNFFWAEEPLEGIIDDIKYNKDQMNVIISYSQRPNFLNTKFAFDNVIFLPARNLSSDKIKKIVSTNLSYSFMLQENRSAKKQLSNQSEIKIQTRYKYVKID